MRRSPLGFLRPNLIELWYIVFISCAFILVGNAKLLLQRAGLISSAHLIGQQVSTKVIWGTNWLSTFRFTAGIINLIIWGATGLVIYSLLQSIVRTLRTIAFERDIDSGRFIHPQNYTHEAYWKQIIADTFLGFILLSLLALGIIGYLYIIVPDSFIFVQKLILHPSFRTLLDPFVGLDILCVGTGILYILIRLVIRHHKITAIEDQ
jgi:hypothetical protein